ncbi:hypothetical protein P1X15_05040 [Runella sp. MFBS21]|uniref:hypothetical protein n=1 Tax=Runella sp. MFBS21 TaxID=3034018 RepID=UPI0023F9EBEF|nr:hypothetical protein [Runella sp. MFBS21]MDF7816946.1 hypothetical protein [Runella sp. MFBS21]
MKKLFSFLLTGGLFLLLACQNEQDPISNRKPNQLSEEITLVNGHLKFSNHKSLQKTIEKLALTDK